MAEIKSGDKVKLNKTLSYKKISMKNGEVENESFESWDEGTEHTVKAVIGELFVVLENISSMVPISYVEKVKKQEKYYTCKIACVGICNDFKNIFSLGKVYDINNGVLLFDNGNELDKIKTLEELNKISGIEFIEIKNPEVLEKDKFYNGKVICICSNGYDQFWTPGKIYKFEDGKTICDDGTDMPGWNGKVKSYYDLCDRSEAVFIEIKE